MNRNSIVISFIGCFFFLQPLYADNQLSPIEMVEKQIDSLLSNSSSTPREHIELMRLIKWNSYLFNDFVSIPPVRPPKYNIKVSSKFGSRVHPIKGYMSQHSGIDLVPMENNDTIYVTATGVVDTIAYNSLLGYHVIVQHRFGYKTIYGHLSQVLIKPKQHLRQAEKIAVMGNTGQSTGKHLHYTLKHNNISLDPYPYCYIYLDAIINNNLTP